MKFLDGTGLSYLVSKIKALADSKQATIDSSHKLSADLVDDTNTTNKFTNSTEKQTWNGKQDALVSGTNIKTLNGESILGSGNMDIIGCYTPTLSNAPTNSTTTYTKDGQTVDFEIGQFARVANANSSKGYDMYQLYNLATESNVTTATWRLVPNNVACLEDTGQSALTPSFDPQNDTVHITQQVLTSAQKAQARQNIGAADAGTSVASSAIRSIVTMTQLDYDSLVTKDNTTLYIII